MRCQRYLERPFKKETLAAHHVPTVPATDASRREDPVTLFSSPSAPRNGITESIQTAQHPMTVIWAMHVCKRFRCGRDDLASPSISWMVTFHS